MTYLVWKYGETDLVEFAINTGNEAPKRQVVRQMPFVARNEVAEQLEKMQQMEELFRHQRVSDQVQ